MTKTLENIVNKETMNQWFEYAADGNIPKVKQLITQGININCVNSNGDSALILSVKKDNEEFVDFMLRHSNLDVNMKNKQGMTALMSCKTHNNIKRLLIHPDIMVDIIDNAGKNFIDHIEPKHRTFLKEYSTQNNMIELNPNNIFIFDIYGLLNEKIKRKYIHLFVSAGIGLI